MDEQSLKSEFKKWLAHKQILAKNSKIYLTTKRRVCLGMIETLFRDAYALNKFEFSKRIVMSVEQLKNLIPSEIDGSHESSTNTLNLLIESAELIRANK